MSNSDLVDSLSGSEIAIIGMAGRFPQARSVDEFWRNLKNGVESVSFFSEDELRASGVPAALIANPGYVRAKAALEDVELFDADFFGFNPREAEILDPQQRFFLEVAWEALENAGYRSDKYKGRVGVYAGASLNTYLLNLYSNRELVESVGPFQLLIASDKDFLTTRASYKLDLTGPSITVQTACSTSLVAVHLACQSLLNGECDMALAGGVSIRFPHKSGHLYQEGSFLSPDGHCRAFDADARGTVSGDGVGIVVLKRLEEAIADADAIRAVIKGSAVNNDGFAKAGYTAPSVEAQAAVIAEAQAIARVDAGTISYIEAHGTGTTLGDPIEIAALTEAFRVSTNRKSYCAIGSVKTNIGHLDAAAGVAGLIKVVKSLEEKQLPASLNFTQPNPKANFPNSPFYVNASLASWEKIAAPRRAGISAFGIGGTNAHVVLEEAPAIASSSESRPWQLLLLSARTETALDRAIFNLAARLRERPEINLADAAYTLAVGRKEFQHRAALVCRDAADARTALEKLDPQKLITSFCDWDDRQIVFMFSGQGSQYVRMGEELYRLEPKFREQIDLCSEILKPHLDCDLKAAMYPNESEIEAAAQSLNQTFITQAALFVTEYALAQLWMHWGIRPRAMIGHSIGEYVAACLAGVLSLEDALRLVAARGRLMQSLPDGAMLAVQLPESEARAMIADELSIAAINSPSSCVISGPVEAIDDLQNRLTEKGARSRRLRASRAFHSRMMEPALDPLREEFKKASLNAPKIPYVSNLTGAWIASREATDPAYWAKHLRETVRFQEGLRALLKGFSGVLLEVGPGDTLSQLARQNLETGSAQVVLSSLRRPDAPRSDQAFLLGALGKLWLEGAQVDWSGFYEQQRRQRAPLPAYPFERRRYWIETENQSLVAGATEEVESRPLARSTHPRPKLGAEYIAPRNELEQALAEIWQALLGTEKVGVYDDFFSLGGHSLLATQLVSQLRETFEVDVPLYKLFETPIIAGLAEVIEEMLIERVEGLTDEDAENFLNAQS